MRDSELFEEADAILLSENLIETIHDDDLDTDDESLENAADRCLKKL